MAHVHIPPPTSPFQLLNQFTDFNETTDQGAWWTPEPMWAFRSTEKSLAPARIRNPERPAHRPVTVPSMV